MNEGNEQLLEQLRDIHLSAGPGWWPPAPGWWVLAGIMLIVLVLALRWLIRRVAILRRRRAYLDALSTLNRDVDPQTQAHSYIAGINRLFRTVAMKAFPGTACASMQGQEWVTFIRSLQAADLDGTSLEALATGPYEPAPEFDVAALNEQARAWVKRYG